MMVALLVKVTATGDRDVEAIVEMFRSRKLSATYDDVVESEGGGGESERWR